MNDELMFGELREELPVSEERPDQIQSFAVEDMPSADPLARSMDLRVFVDIDVMRELESHANDNTDVELGGVLMGRQAIDGEGRPFVVVTDSIRAQHYQATRGSFKFTHETWEQITRDRDQMPHSLRMVGWYHTHPGWGVFLSGMDDFICENFFARPLDLALVLDPCRQEHGWFQWDEGRTRLTAAVSWFSRQNRAAELKAFAATYSQEYEMAIQRNPIRSQTVAPGTTVQIVEGERRSDWPLLAVLAVQAIVLLLVAWMVARQPVAESSTASTSARDVEALTRQLTLLEIKNEILTESLRVKLSDPAGELNSIDALARERAEKASLAETVESHAMRIKSLESQRLELANRETRLRDANDQLQSQLQGFLAQQTAASESDGGNGIESIWDRYWLTGVLATLCGLVIAGGVIWWFARQPLDSMEVAVREDQE
jgi:proteasome lid subunit RPN8/RPN11